MKPPLELLDILDLLWNGALDVSTSKDFRTKTGELDEAKYLTAQTNIKQHVAQQIIDWVVSKLPEEYELPAVPLTRKLTYDETVNLGFNMAINEMKRNIGMDSK